MRAKIWRELKAHLQHQQHHLPLHIIRSHACTRPPSFTIHQTKQKLSKLGLFLRLDHFKPDKESLYAIPATRSSVVAGATWSSAHLPGRYPGQEGYQKPTDPQVGIFLLPVIQCPVPDAVVQLRPVIALRRELL